MFEVAKSEVYARTQTKTIFLTRSLHSSFPMPPMSTDPSTPPDTAVSPPEDRSSRGEDSETVREIPLEEFQPVGTLAVTGLYFLLLLVLYALLYFVEFAGNAPSIIE